MGFPYFNPPNIQKINTIEEGNFFVPTEGVEPESVHEEPSLKAAKVKRVLKITLAAVGVIAFAALAYFCLRDYFLYGIY